MAERLNINMIYNIPCEPDLNAIENYFSAFKAHYKKLRLDQMMFKKQARIVKLMKLALRQVKHQSINNTVTACQKKSHSLKS